MNHEFGHRLTLLWRGILPLILLGGYIAWRGSSIDPIVIIVLCLIALFFIVRNALPICRVVLSDSDIRIVFLLPIRRGGKFLHADIEWYQELAIDKNEKKIVIGGFLKPKGQERIFLIDAGTNNFIELNAALLELYQQTDRPD